MSGKTSKTNGENCQLGLIHDTNIKLSKQFHNIQAVFFQVGQILRNFLPFAVLGRIQIQIVLSALDCDV